MRNLVQIRMFAIIVKFQALAAPLVASTLSRFMATAQRKTSNACAKSQGMASSMCERQ